jgi:hypothetical protein
LERLAAEVGYYSETCGLPAILATPRTADERAELLTL